MNQAQCLELRDLISASTFPANEHGYAAHRFSYVAVVPGAEDPDEESVDATVLYHCLAAAWQRAGAQNEAEAFIKELVSQSPFHGRNIKLQYLPVKWEELWSITAVSHSSNTPVLILILGWIAFLIPIPGVSSFVGWPLSVAATILAIISIAKSGVKNGLGALLCSLIFSPIIYFVGLGIMLRVFVKSQFGI